MGKIIAIHGRSGTGKSTLASNLSYLLAEKEKLVILMDTNMDYSGTPSFFAEEIPANKGIFAAMEDSAGQPGRFLVPCKQQKNLFFFGIPTNRNTFFYADLMEHSTENLVQQLAVCCDYLILDCTADWRQQLTQMALYLCDTVIVTYTASVETGSWHQGVQHLYQNLKIENQIPVMGQWNIGCSMQKFEEQAGLKHTVRLPEVEDAEVARSCGRLLCLGRSKSERLYRERILNMIEEVK